MSGGDESGWLGSCSLHAELLNNKECVSEHGGSGQIIAAAAIRRVLFKEKVIYPDSTRQNKITRSDATQTFSYSTLHLLRLKTNDTR